MVELLKSPADVCVNKCSNDLLFRPLPKCESLIGLERRPTRFHGKRHGCVSTSHLQLHSRVRLLVQCGHAAPLPRRRRRVQVYFPMARRELPSRWCAQHSEHGKSTRVKEKILRPALPLPQGHPTPPSALCRRLSKFPRGNK